MTDGEQEAAQEPEPITPDITTSLRLPFLLLLPSTTSTTLVHIHTRLCTYTGFDFCIRSLAIPTPRGCGPGNLPLLLPFRSVACLDRVASNIRVDSPGYRY